jgi:hypothetical protein
MRAIRPQSAVHRRIQQARTQNAARKHRNLRTGKGGRLHRLSRIRYIPDLDNLRGSAWQKIVLHMRLNLITVAALDE